MGSRARLLDLGVRPYREVWDLQHRLHEAVRDGREPDTWIVVEHPAVITLGRQAKPENVITPAGERLRLGIDLVHVERGGDVTYHGPGQLVVYPIRKLERFREVVPLVRSLEATVINLCTHFGVRGERWSGHAGVWVGRNQICAIGLAVQRMVSLHGIALNVSTRLDYDRLIVPCGVRDRGITSLCAETGREIAMDTAKDAMLEELARTFELEFVQPVEA